MQRSHTVNKGKTRAKPYDRITLSKDIQDRLSQYIAGDAQQAGTSLPRNEKGKVRRRRDIVKAEPEDPVLGDDEDQSNPPAHDTSEHEVAHELRESRRFAHTVISSDPNSDQDELDISEPEIANDLTALADHTSGLRGDHRKRDTKRPTQTFSSPLAKFGHHSPLKVLSQPDGRPSIEELDKFAEDMTGLIDSFSKRATALVLKFVNGRGRDPGIE